MIAFLVIMLLAVTKLGSGAEGDGIADAIDVGGRKQLFVDDRLIASQVNVTRELGRVEKANAGKPVFTEGWFYGTVLRHDDRFKLWWRKPGMNGFGYAESDDGLRFRKLADLTGIHFAGDYTLAVEFDSHEADPDHRFKASYDAPGMAAGLAHSADGIHWTPYHGGKPVTGRAADTYNQILWDDIARTYRLFTRTDFGTPGGNSELRGTRSMTNSDPKNHPAQWKTVREWKFDQEGPQEANRRQVYAATCWIYEGVYFALLSVYEYPGDTSEGRETDRHRRHERDVMNFYIATSRDGDAWNLQCVYGGKPMIPRGPDGAFDKDLLLPASTILTHHDQHWLYYAGGNERHGTEQVRFDRDHAIGLAKLRLDGFVALAAGDDSGVIITKPLTWDGDRLQINVVAREGQIHVELLNEAGQPLPGFTAEASAVNDVRWEPTWNSQSKLSDLKGRAVRVKLTLRNAKAYAIQFR